MDYSLSSICASIQGLYKILCFLWNWQLTCIECAQLDEYFDMIIMQYTLLSVCM